MLKQNKIYLGDNLELLKQLEDNSIHSCVSDFPYNLGFMGRKWDTIQNYYQWNYDRAVELLRVLKPGGYCLIFGGTRTHHRLVCAFEDAGFQIKDEIQWIYGNGMAKSQDLSKIANKQGIVNYEDFQGLGSNIKPAQEPIMVARKPLKEKTILNNYIKYNTGALHIDDCRIPYESDGNLASNPSLRSHINGGNGGNIIAHEENRRIVIPNELGRFPTNIILDEATKKIMDKQAQETIQNKNYINESKISRFFYCPKASKKDRNENGLVNNNHVTVKPTELIKYLVKLVTPSKGICLDICEGSGTHVKAILWLNKEGFNFSYIGFENNEDNYNIACKREKINKVS